MDYYQMELSPFRSELSTLVLPWGKYEYQHLPMGLSNSPNIVQEQISALMPDLENVRSYINDCLVLTTGLWEDHIQKLDTVLMHLRNTGLKFYSTKSFIGHAELEYLS